MAGDVRRTFCSWEEAGWRSLYAQRLVFPPVGEDLYLPGNRDVYLSMGTVGRATVSTRIDDRRGRIDWVPGGLGFKGPGQSAVFNYRSEQPLECVQVYIPYRTIEQTVERLGGRVVDYERIAVSLPVGDPLVEQTIRAVDAAAQSRAEDLYAESAAAFLAVHLLTSYSGHPASPVPGHEDSRVRTVITLMRDRLAEPLTLAELADEVFLSVYHLVRVFKEATGETPHRYLTGLRVRKAQHLLRHTNLSIAEIATRCGFGSPGALSTAFLRHAGVRPSTYRGT